MRPTSRKWRRLTWCRLRAGAKRLAKKWRFAIRRKQHGPDSGSAARTRARVQKGKEREVGFRRLKKTITYNQHPKARLGLFYYPRTDPATEIKTLPLLLPLLAPCKVTLPGPQVSARQNPIAALYRPRGPCVKWGIKLFRFVSSRHALLHSLSSASHSPTAKTRTSCDSFPIRNLL